MNKDEFFDPIYEEAVLFAREKGTVSISSLQRKFLIGYNRATRLISLLEADGIIGSSNDSIHKNVMLDKEVTKTNEENVLRKCLVSMRTNAVAIIGFSERNEVEENIEVVRENNSIILEAGKDLLEVLNKCIAELDEK